MANCKPCFEEGRGQVIAHYQGTPAGMTRTGKEVPPQCYHHRNKLPLPAISKAPPVNAGFDPNAPTVPVIVAPKVVTAKVVTAKAIAPEVDRGKETDMAEKVKCSHPECHTMIRASNKSGACTPHWYWATHGKKVAGGGVSQEESPAKPTPRRKAAPRKPARTNGHAAARTNGHAAARTNGNGAVRGNGADDAGELMQIQVSEAALDRLWAKLTGPEKAKAAAAVIG